MFSPGCLFEYKHDRVYLDFVACNPNDLLLIDGFQLIFFFYLPLRLHSYKQTMERNFFLIDGSSIQPVLISNTGEIVVVFFWGSNPGLFAGSVRQAC